MGPGRLLDAAVGGLGEAGQGSIGGADGIPDEAGEPQIATLTEDALVQRLHATGPFLEELVRRVLTGAGEAPAWHGRALRVADSTSLSQPASKATDWRLHGV